MPTVLVAVYFAAGVIAAFYAVLSWRRRHLTPLAPPLALIMAGAAEWSTAQALSVAAPAPAVSLAFNYGIFPGVAMVVAGYFWYATAFTRHRWSRPRRRSLLLVHPVLLVAVVATDPWHHTFYRLVDSTAQGIVLHPGPAYWAHTVYCYTLLTIGTALAVRAMRRAVRGHRRVFVLFLAGGLAPTAGNLVTLFADIDAQRIDLTPMLFLVTGITWWWAERSGVPRQRIPVAYEQVIATIGDAVMVLDPDGRFLDVNPAATTMLTNLHPATSGQVVGRQWQEVVGPHLTAAFANTSHRTITTESGTVYDVRMVGMQSPDGTCPGTVVVVRDITELERLRAELTEQTVRDSLTGVYNRRHLTATLDAQVRDAAAGGYPLSAVMIDVDHFKSVNDRYGHAVGDEVLIQLAGRITGGLRATDTVARYGGEEFVVVMPGADAQSAAERADAWRRQCVDVTVTTSQGPLHVTFSAGVAQLPPGGCAEELLRLADTALYQAKGAGRNRVVTAGRTWLEPDQDAGGRGAAVGSAAAPGGCQEGLPVTVPADSVTR